MTWITPLAAITSVCSTVAPPFKRTVPPATVMRIVSPWALRAVARRTTSAASTRPGTTW
jgi:hypothetical protein